MATADLIEVKRLIIDLKNFRTVPQATEKDAIHALITIGPEKFWALMESLISNGYFLTENILVLKAGKKMYVQEGNRRVAAMKMILGYVTVPNVNTPAEIEEKIVSISKEWRQQNKSVPCAIYDADEVGAAGRIVALTHGKGEQAGRSQWNAMARARHNRSQGASEPALKLLEAYLKNGKNLTPEEAELWAGEYKLTVLQEALQAVASRMGFSSVRDLADAYPGIPKHKSSLDAMLRDVGRGILDFPIIRSAAEDFAAARYSVKPVASQLQNVASANYSPATNVAGQGPGTVAQTGAVPKKLKASAVNDARSVIRKLRQFHPKGKNREKLVTLLIEARGLKLTKHAHSFCFLLRSMFELSAKAYCDDHAGAGLSVIKQNGEDKKLVDALNQITGHLTKNKTDKTMMKSLHGAFAELNKPHGFLSVTSLNQLIHNNKFIVDETHISNLFFNVFPLLEAMNK